MKRVISFVLIFAVLLSSCCVIFPDSALAYTSASSKIRIITQHQNRYKKLIMPGHPTLTVYEGGCGLFSIAHAMQWLSNKKLTSDEEYTLLKKLVDWKLDTAPNAESAGQGTSRGMSACLTTLTKKDKSLNFHKGVMTPSYMTEDNIKSIFDNNGAIIANPSGHYVAAVGYQTYNNKLYIQIVDSSVHSTIEPRSDLKLHVGYTYSSNKMNEIKKSKGDTGGEYFIPWDCFRGKCSHERKFQNWWWLSGYSTELGELNSQTYSVTVTNDGNGTGSASPASGKTGTEVTLTATPNSGYRFKDWQVVSGGVTVSNNKFTIGSADVTVKACFEKIPEYTVTVTNDGNGTGSASPASGTAGTEVILTATPNNGYQFKEWQVVSGGVTVSNNKFTIGNADVTVKACFEEVPLTISLQSSASVSARDIITLDARLSDNGAIIWNTSDPDTVMVSDSGQILGIRPGSATVTATAASDSSVTASCVVTVAYPENLNSISPGLSTTWNLGGSWGAAIEFFVPDYTGFFTFESSGECDAYGYVFDDSWQLLAADDDSAGNRQFRINREFEAGKVYFLIARMYSPFSTEGQITTRLEEEEIVLDGIIIDETNFPDETFRSFVRRFDMDANGRLSDEEINAVTEINCSEMSIYDLKGIEYFTSLTYLCCSSNNLIELDVSKNTNLSILDFWNNGISAIDVSNNNGLVALYGADNQLTSLNVSNIPYLQIIYCSGNKLDSLITENLPNLWLLSCHHNNLRELNVSSLPMLFELECQGNQLQTLDISGCPKLLNLVAAVGTPTSQDGYLEYAQQVNEQNLWLRFDPSVIIETGEEEADPLAESIKLNKKKATLTCTSDEPNPTLELKATIRPEGADDTVEWESSNPKVATVDDDGTVTALKKGTAKITCRTTDGSGLSASCKITVKYRLIEAITLNKKKITLQKPGATYKLKVKTVTPDDAFNQKVKWTTTNKKVATVNSSGKVTAKGKGTCYIKCTTTDGSKITVKCKVTVSNSSITGISLNQESASLKMGEPLKLKAGVTAPNDGGLHEVVWSTSDGKVATVDNKGRVHAVSQGTCFIICSAADDGKICARCQIIVK